MAEPGFKLRQFGSTEHAFNHCSMVTLEKTRDSLQSDQDRTRSPRWKNGPGSEKYRDCDAKEKKMNTPIGYMLVRLIVGLGIVSVMTKHC